MINTKAKPKETKTTRELSQNLFCIQMRSGAEIWVEQERAQKLQTLLEGISTHRFVLFEDQTVNTADIVGIFSAETMSEVTHRKNGEWKCEHNRWYGKFEKCECGRGVDRYPNFSRYDPTKLWPQ